MVINRKVLPWLIAGVALAAILLIVLVMVTQASPNSAPHRQGTSGENLLINPSFESGMSNWTTSSASATENDVALCGSGGVTVTSDVGGSIYQTIVSIPTSTIYVNAFFRTDSTATAVLRYDSVNVNGQSANAVVSQGIDSGDGWTQLSLLVQGVGQYPITLTVSVGTNAAESVMVDSIWVGDYNNDDICAGWQPDPIPQIVSYQGQVSIGGIPYSGTGYFQFAIVDSVDTLYWSNDGSTITPTEAVTLTVVNGLFNALLGETNPITYGMFSNSDRWLRIWFDDGIHGVQLLEPDAPFTTAPFTFQADNAMTAMTATIAMNALTFNTLQPSIIGDPYNGDPRGLCAVDLQLARANPNQTACGPYSTISGGRSNVAGGSYSVVGGGWENYVSGYIATVIGGRLNSARGNYSVASGFRADTGIGRNGVFIFGDSSDEDFTGIINDEFAIRARGGFRHAYDNSNWWTAKVTSGGAVTFDSVGTAPGFTISDSLTVNGIFSATVLTATYATTALTATNATTATYATTAGSATTALTATNATTATYATTVLTATNAITATFATTALTATNATTATYASTVPGYIIVQLAQPVIAINATFSTVAASTEITNTTLGIPASAKGILYELTAVDSGVASQYFRFGPSATYYYQATVTTQVTGITSRDNGISFTDSNGSIWYRSLASGSNTLTVYMRVWGYLK